jgi:8-oxo-dGTP pyrophosphatase MutT (NUDIX family)
MYYFIMRQIGFINLENVSEDEAKGYKKRQAARAIVFDNEGKIALLHATKNFYYKLPGGGIEENETIEEALKRACLEEIGCNVEVVGELGFTLEYRKKYNLSQISHCYIAKLVGKKGTPKLEKDEIEEGFETTWFSLNEALEMVKNSKPTIYEGPYMVTRDTLLLEAALQNNLKI